MIDFAADLKAHGGEPGQVRHVCQDMSVAYAKGVTKALGASERKAIKGLMWGMQLKHLPAHPFGPAAAK